MFFGLQVLTVYISATYELVEVNWDFAETNMTQLQGEPRRCV